MINRNEGEGVLRTGKTRYRVIAIYDTVYDVTSITTADLPLDTPLMFVVSRYKDGRKRMGFKRLTPTKPLNK